ncbi:hypothetical protein [Sinomonas atrocyanea]
MACEFQLMDRALCPVTRDGAVLGRICQGLVEIRRALASVGVGLGVGESSGVNELGVFPGFLRSAQVTRWVRDWPWLLAGLAIVPVVLIRAGVMAESDTFWQIRTGLLILDTGWIPTHDGFSWTAAGDPWVLNSWGFDVLIAAFYRAAGLPGVALVCAALAFVCLAVVLRLSYQLGAAPAVACVMLVLASPLLIGWLSARPQLIDYIAVPLLVILLRRFAHTPGPRLIAAAGALLLAWTNLHAASLLGGAIIVAAGLLAVARRATRTAWRWFLALGVAALVGSLANPYGWGIFSQAAAVRDSSAAVVVEWQPLALADPVQLGMLALGLVAFVVSLRRREDAVTAAIAVTAASSIVAARMLPILLLLSIPVIAAALTGLPALRRYARPRRRMLSVGALLAVGGLVVSAVPSLNHLGEPDPGQYSTALVRSIPANCKVFNSYALGGFILLERPDVKVSIDSRNDLYGPRRVLDAQQVIQGTGNMQEGLVGAQCVLVPGTTPLAQNLQHSQQWRQIASDTTGILFTRTMG